MTGLHRGMSACGPVFYDLYYVDSLLRLITHDGNMDGSNPRENENPVFPYCFQKSAGLTSQMLFLVNSPIAQGEVDSD